MLHHHSRSLHIIERKFIKEYGWLVFRNTCTDLQQALSLEFISEKHDIPVEYLHLLKPVVC